MNEQRQARDGEGRFAPLYLYDREQYEMDRARIRRECGLEPETGRIPMHIMQQQRHGGQS